MTGKSFDYLQESGTFGYAAETAEGQLKPEAGIDLTEAEVVAATIAVWIKAQRQQLADVSDLQRTLSDRLMYLVMRRLQDQVIAGDGTGENLLGITKTNGIGAVPFAAGALTDLVLDGIVGTLVSDATPDAVVVNPVDYSAMLKAKTSGSGDRLDSAGAFGTVPVTMWGLPAIPSNAIAQGTALVGAFSTQARLYVREAVHVRITDSDQDDFVKNRVTLLGEGRFGLAVWAPAAFCLVDLAA